MGVTTKTIAQRLNVSRITVDRALNGRPGISEKRRQQILAAAKEMGYRPHRLAQALVNGVSKSLGVIVFDLHNAFFAQLVDAFQNAAFEAGYVTYIMLTNKDPAVERDCLERLLDRRVDGILLDSVIGEPDYAQYLKSLDVPVITVMNRVSEDIPLVSINNYRAMLDMTNHIISKDYARIIYVCPPLQSAAFSNMSSLIDRKNGFEDAIAQSRGPLEVIRLEDQQYMQKLSHIDFSCGVRTAIICTSDIFAVSIMNALQKRGLRPPMDYGLSGFDNIPMLHEFEPNITTVTLFMHKMGTRCARLLIGAVNGEPLEKYVETPYEIAPGQTVL